MKRYKPGVVWEYLKKVEQLSEFLHPDIAIHPEILQQLYEDTRCPVLIGGKAGLVDRRYFYVLNRIDNFRELKEGFQRRHVLKLSSPTL